MWAPCLLADVSLALPVMLLFWGLRGDWMACCCSQEGCLAASLQLQLEMVWETLEGCPQGSDGLPRLLLQSASQTWA